MTSARIDLPEPMPFATEASVRIQDVNYGGHLGNDALVSLLHEARLRCLAEHGLSERDCGGAGLILTELEVVYRAEAFHGDLLRIEVAVTDLRGGSASFRYRVQRPADGREIARARTGMAFLDYDSRRVRRMPRAFATAFSAGD